MRIPFPILAALVVLPCACGTGSGDPSDATPDAYATDDGATPADSGWIYWDGGWTCPAGAPCQDGWNTDATPPQDVLPDAGASVSTLVKAAEGGTVATADGRASIAFPAGALAEDTAITIEPATDLPLGASYAGAAWKFGPDGTLLRLPATVTLKLDLPSTPPGTKIQMARLEGDKFDPIRQVSLAGGYVSTQVGHIAAWAPIVASDWGIDAEAGQCAKLSFTACGGDPSGALWAPVAFCPANAPAATALPAADNPFADIAACGDTTRVTRTRTTGGVLMRTDGTMYGGFGVESEGVLSFPDACLAGVAAELYAGQDLSNDAVCDAIAVDDSLKVRWPGGCVHGDGACRCIEAATATPAVPHEGTCAWKDGTITGSGIAPLDGTVAFCTDWYRLWIELDAATGTGKDYLHLQRL